jgi:hypothetical protein
MFCRFPLESLGIPLALLHPLVLAHFYAQFTFQLFYDVNGGDNFDFLTFFFTPPIVVSSGSAAI